MAQIGNQMKKMTVMIMCFSVNPVIRLDGEQNECIPLSEQWSKRVIDEMFTPKTGGRVRTRGGISGKRG